MNANEACCQNSSECATLAHPQGITGCVRNQKRAEECPRDHVYTDLHEPDVVDPSSHADVFSSHLVHTGGRTCSAHHCYSPEYVEMHMAYSHQTGGPWSLRSAMAYSRQNAGPWSPRSAYQGS